MAMLTGVLIACQRKVYECCIQSESGDCPVIVYHFSIEKYFSIIFSDVLISKIAVCWQVQTCSVIHVQELINILKLITSAFQVSEKLKSVIKTCTQDSPCVINSCTNSPHNDTSEPTMANNISTKCLEHINDSGSHNDSHKFTRISIE